jgi:hypothetical protein
VWNNERGDTGRRSQGRGAGGCRPLGSSARQHRHDEHSDHPCAGHGGDRSIRWPHCWRLHCRVSRHLLQLFPHASLPLAARVRPPGPHHGGPATRRRACGRRAVGDAAPVADRGRDAGVGGPQPRKRRRATCVEPTLDSVCPRARRPTSTLGLAGCRLEPVTPTEAGCSWSTGRVDSRIGIPRAAWATAGGRRSDSHQPGRTLGYVVLVPTPGRGTSRDERRVAVALSDLLAVAIGVRPLEKARE